MLEKKYILGIDTSCDDTSFAFLDRHSKKIVANVISSQVDVHAEFGGIVPEIASRSHLENISTIFHEIMKTPQIAPEEIDSVAVTNTPGLIGCLLVGTSFAQGLAYQLNVPLHAVNHLEAHLFSPFLEKEAIFPFLGLVVSGGHTAFYHVTSFEDVVLVGQTVDDAAGEAFDKAAKMMGLAYPGGPLIDKLAQQGNDAGFAFKVAKVKMGEEYLSFSGLKTAAHLHVKKNSPMTQSMIQDLSASLQKGIVDALCLKLEYFLKGFSYQAFALSGGVAMNSLLRARVERICHDHRIGCFLAEPRFCSDNGAMIAHVALVKECPNELFSLSVRASQKIQARKLYHAQIDTKKN